MRTAPGTDPEPDQLKPVTHCLQDRQAVCNVVLLRTFILGLLTLTFVSTTLNQQIVDPVSVASKAFDYLLAGEYHELRKMFDPKMLSAVSEDRLKNEIGPPLHALGKAEQIGDAVVRRTQNVSIVIFPVHFSTGNFDIVLPVDAEGKLAGIFFRPGNGPSEALTRNALSRKEPAWSSPPYANTGAFHNREITVGTGEWKLPGTLSIPNGSGPFPAIALVHGSGPQDRDETLGPNKPFRDIAEGLASRGIAVLRYDKRTKVYAQQIAASKDFTVNQEAVDDALQAIRWLREQHEVDRTRVFFLGHSLGGYLAPRIARRDPQVAGIIIMAGNSRPVEDTMVEQFAYLGAAADQLEELKQEVAAIRKLNSAGGPAILNAPRSYWLDLKAYDPKADVTKLHCRILVLQGGRDYQVISTDYAGWQDALKDRRNATFHLYPALNHLFVAGEGKSMPAEYEKRGHVSSEVIDHIAAWIKT